LRAALARELETLADLDALDGLCSHQRRREPRVESLLFRRIRAESRRDAARAHLDDAADGVTLGPRLVDARLEVAAADAAFDLDADLTKQGLRNGTGRNDHRRVPSTRALERVAHVGEPVLERTGEVGVAG